MRRVIVLVFVWIMLMIWGVPSLRAAEEQGGSVLSQVDLSQFIYSYGTVLKVSDQEIVLQEYDYDSDVEKEVVYKIIAETKFEGFKSINELAVDDVLEVYYSEDSGQRVAKIIHRELIDDETMDNGS